MRESEKIDEFLAREASREYWDRLRRGRRVALDILQHAISKQYQVSVRSLDALRVLHGAVQHVHES